MSRLNISGRGLRHVSSGSVRVNAIPYYGADTEMDNAAGESAQCVQNSPQLSAELISRALDISHREPRGSPPLHRLALILTALF